MSPPRLTVLALLAAGGCALASAGSAAAATTTIGHTGGDESCFAGVVVADTNDVIPPGGGVITSFSYGDDGNNAGAELDFEVLQPNSDGSYTIVADTGLQTLTGANGNETFAANIPVTGGEILGYYESGLDNCLEGGTLDSVPFEFFGSDPSPGQTLAPPNVYIDQGISVNESATLQGAAAGVLSAQGGSVSGTEGATTSGQVGSFSDPDGQPGSDYTATIKWGDGSTSSGSISELGAGRYAINGSHTYAEAGVYDLSISISDVDGGAATAQGLAAIGDASLSAQGVGATAAPVATLSSFSGRVAALTDTNPSGSAKDFTATIDWGDGTDSNGTVIGGGGSYIVTGSHVYPSDGPRTVRVHVVDADGSTADAASYVVVYETANNSGGSFVIGDLAAGPTVYFWGSQWQIQNPMSGGSAPASFRGFADHSAQSCGQSFTAAAGNGSTPPARVPAYMAVAVTSHLTKTGRQISGTVQKIVVVKTAPGYRPDLGSAGTGSVVATVCG